MTPVVQYGRRRGSSKSAEEVNKILLPPDLRQVTVLNRAEWLRIQDSLNKVNKDKETMREAAKQREALHLQSKEVVNLWSNTIAGQRQKKLEARKIREQTEEEKRKLIDIEEAKFKEQKRKEIIEKAKTQLYYQTDRVRGLHRALLLTEVLHEREAQAGLKQMIKNASEDMAKEFMDRVKTEEDEALRQAQEKAHQKKLDGQALANDLKEQIKEGEQVRERENMESKKEREELQRLHELYHWEQKMEEEREAEQKRNYLQAHLEELNMRDLMRAADAQKRKAEDKQRENCLEGKQKMMTLRKEKENELLRAAQSRRDRVINKLSVERHEEQHQQTINEEQSFAKAVAERDAKLVQQQKEAREKKAAMIKAMAAQRELMRQEKEQVDKIEQQNERDLLQAKREAHKIFIEKQKVKAQRLREEEKKLQDFNYILMAAKIAENEQMRRNEHEFVAKNTEVIDKEENQFQQYSQHIISAAVKAQRNVFPLYKAARDGVGGGLGPVFGGARPSYLVQDRSGAEMPKYVFGASQYVHPSTQPPSTA